MFCSNLIYYFSDINFAISEISFLKTIYFIWLLCFTNICTFIRNFALSNIPTISPFSTNNWESYHRQKHASKINWQYEKTNKNTRFCLKWSTTGCTFPSQARVTSSMNVVYSDISSQARKKKDHVRKIKHYIFPSITFFYTAI